MKASQKLTPSIAQMRGIKVMIVATAPVNCDHFVVDIEVIVVLTVKSIFYCSPSPLGSARNTFFWKD